MLLLACAFDFPHNALWRPSAPMPLTVDKSARGDRDIQQITQIVERCKSVLVSQNDSPSTRMVRTQDADGAALAAARASMLRPRSRGVGAKIHRARRNA